MAAFSDVNLSFPLSLDHPLSLPVAFDEHQPQRYLQATKTGVTTTSHQSTHSSAFLFSTEVLLILLLPLLGILFCVFPIICRSSNRRHVQDEQQQKTENDEEAAVVLRQKILKSISSKHVCLVIEENHLRFIGNNASTDAESSSANFRSSLELDAPKHEHDNHPSPARADGEKTTTQVSGEEYDLEAGRTMQQATDEQIDDGKDGVLYLPHRAPAAVSNVCAICLETYRAGDAVIWSSSTENNKLVRCSHVFHTDCLVDYAVIKAKGRGCMPIPCPTCRQSFIEIIKVQDHQPSMDDKCDGDT